VGGDRAAGAPLRPQGSARERRVGAAAGIGAQERDEVGVVELGPHLDPVGGGEAHVSGSMLARPGHQG
jgi:hypothetical protein